MLAVGDIYKGSNSIPTKKKSSATDNAAAELATPIKTAAELRRDVQAQLELLQGRGIASNTNKRAKTDAVL